MEESRWRILVRVLSGEASRAEAAELQRWVEEDPANAEAMGALRALWEASGRLPDRGDEEAIWRKVTERTNLARRTPAPVVPLRALRRRAVAGPGGWRSAPLRIAAAIALLVGAAALSGPTSGLVRERLVNRTVVTGKGEQMRLVLEDGSRVLLGVDSRLTYPRRFAEGAREIHLEGTGYFEVASDPSRPFSVHTPDAVMRVLGTKFSVRDYAGGEPVRVVVSEGKVAVRPAEVAPDDSARIAILVGGQAADLPSPELPAVIAPVDTAQDLQWTRGVIAFKNAPVPQVLEELGRWYDVRIEVPDSALAARHLTISFDQEPLQTILHEIALALGARVQRNGREFLLVPARQVQTESPTLIAGDRLQ